MFIKVLFKETDTTKCTRGPRICNQVKNLQEVQVQHRDKKDYHEKMYVLVF